MLVPVGAIHIACYLTLNHVQLVPSRPLPLTALDEVMPFWTWTTWPYLLLIGPVTWAICHVRDGDVFRRTLRAYAVAFILAFPFYVVMPTHYPRPPAPNGTGISSALYRLLVQVDTPECCFPSGHVILPVLAAWALCRDGRKFGTPFAVLVALMLPSILTTKQHYAWDVAGGLVLTAIGIWASRFPVERALRLTG
ncbi:MAG: hypothetical protein GY711_01315 [bacterium]|nr:hypothetical protein [bacterium]